MRTMDNNMKEYAGIQRHRNHLFEMVMDKEEAKMQKAKARNDKIKYVQQLTRECGADDKNMKLWIGVLKIT